MSSTRSRGWPVHCTSPEKRWLVARGCQGDRGLGCWARAYPNPELSNTRSHRQNNPPSGTTCSRFFSGHWLRSSYNFNDRNFILVLKILLWSMDDGFVQSGSVPTERPTMTRRTQCTGARAWSPEHHFASQHGATCSWLQKFPSASLAPKRTVSVSLMARWRYRECQTL